MILYAYLKDSWRLQRSPNAAYGVASVRHEAGAHWSFRTSQVGSQTASPRHTGHIWAHLGTEMHLATPKAATGPWATPSAPLLICKVASSSAQSCTIQGSLHPSSPSWNGWTCDTPFLRPRSAKYNVSGKEMQGSIAQMPLKHWNRFEPIWADLNRLEPTETDWRNWGKDRWIVVSSLNGVEEDLTLLGTRGFL